MRRASRWILGAAALASAAPAAALTIGPGQAIEVPFSLTAPASGADTLTFNLVGVVAAGVATMTVELYDGAVLLAVASGVPVAGIAGFVDVPAGSDWTTHAAPADLASVRDGTIEGRIRVLPDFAGAGSLTAEVSAFTSLLVGNGTGAAELLPTTGVVSVGTAFAVPEPALGLLLAAALPRLRRRTQPPRIQ